MTHSEKERYEAVVRALYWASNALMEQLDEPEEDEDEEQPAQSLPSAQEDLWAAYWRSCEVEAGE
jgi:hypothetical protein